MAHQLPNIPGLRPHLDVVWVDRVNGFFCARSRGVTHGGTPAGPALYTLWSREVGDELTVFVGFTINSQEFRRLRDDGAIEARYCVEVGPNEILSCYIHRLDGSCIASLINSPTNLEFDPAQRDGAWLMDLTRSPAPLLPNAIMVGDVRAIAGVGQAVNIVKVLALKSIQPGEEVMMRYSPEEREGRPIHSRR